MSHCAFPCVFQFSFHFSTWTTCCFVSFIVNYWGTCSIQTSKRTTVSLSPFAKTLPLCLFFYGSCGVEKLRLAYRQNMYVIVGGIVIRKTIFISTWRDWKVAGARHARSCNIMCVMWLFGFNLKCTVGTCTTFACGEVLRSNNNHLCCFSSYVASVYRASKLNNATYSSLSACLDRVFIL